MNSITIEEIISGPGYGADIKALSSVFQEMDRAYDRVASQYGFACSGCEDNCCYSTFYHHTLAEYLYLKQGIAGLPKMLREHVVEKALSAVKKRPGEKVMCPLNDRGLCSVYEFRPMVCRLHGLAHELNRPGAGPCVRSPGCDLFEALRGDKAYVPFDRTPFYIKMAGVEKAIRQKSGYTEKIKLTVAEMILR